MGYHAHNLSKAEAAVGTRPVPGVQGLLARIARGRGDAAEAAGPDGRDADARAAGAATCIDPAALAGLVYDDGGAGSGAPPLPPPSHNTLRCRAADIADFLAWLEGAGGGEGAVAVEEGGAGASAARSAATAGGEGKQGRWASTPRYIVTGAGLVRFLSASGPEEAADMVARYLEKKKTPREKGKRADKPATLRRRMTTLLMLQRWAHRAGHSSADPGQVEAVVREGMEPVLRRRRATQGAAGPRSRPPDGDEYVPPPAPQSLPDVDPDPDPDPDPDLVRSTIREAHDRAYAAVEELLGFGDTLPAAVGAPPRVRDAALRALRDAALIAVLGATGCRRGDLGRLDESDFHAPEAVRRLMLDKPSHILDELDRIAGGDEDDAYVAALSMPAAPADRRRSTDRGPVEVGLYLSTARLLALYQAVDRLLRGGRRRGEGHGTGKGPGMAEGAERTERTGHQAPRPLFGSLDRRPGHRGGRLNPDSVSRIVAGLSEGATGDRVAPRELVRPPAETREEPGGRGAPRERGTAARTSATAATMSASAQSRPPVRHGAEGPGVHDASPEAREGGDMER